MCNLREAYGGVNRYDEGVYRFVAPIMDDDEYCGDSTRFPIIPNGGKTTSTTKVTYDPKTSNIGLNQRIQDLRVVNNPDSSWFLNIFGTFKYAHDYFNDDDYRFELDYYNQTYFIYRSLGVESETHKRGWFWWYNVDSNEMILGINKIHLVYKYPQPKLEHASSYVQNQLNSLTRQPLSLHNDSFYIKNNNSVYNPVTIKLLNNSRIPFFEFRDDEILNIYIGGNFLGLNIDIRYNVLNDSNIKALYGLGASFLEKQVLNLMVFVLD